MMVGLGMQEVLLLGLFAVVGVGVIVAVVVANSSGRNRRERPPGD